MRRREFMTLVGGTAVAWPLVARAQPAMPVIGYLSSRGNEPGSAALASAFRHGLGEIGYVEGSNVAIEYRWAENRYDRIPALAAELVRKRVDVIAVSGPAAQPAKAATATIPIVFITGDDPVKIGLVAALNRPGGNLTGVVTLGGELGSKRLELLHQLLPATKTFGLLINPTRRTLAEVTSRDVQAAARTLGLEVRIVHASTERELETAFAGLPQLGAGGLVIGGDAFFNSLSPQLATLSARHKLPAIYQYREFVAAGGLMSYGGSLTDSFRLTGVYAGRILKGEKPAELPVQQSTKVELMINLKTAKTLGIEVPATLLARADEVIE
jgi:putative ABC transport system substrate-binding protein